MLLVDGDHSYRGALQDIRNMRALAKPGAVLLVDDLDEGPGPALRQAQAEGLIEMLERRVFNASWAGSEGGGRLDLILRFSCVKAFTPTHPLTPTAS